MLRRTPCVVLLAALSLSTLGCDDDACDDVNCSPCPRFGSLTVTDSMSGGPVPGTEVTGGGVAWTCEVRDGATRCTTVPAELPDEVVTASVSAPGYTTQHFQLTPFEESSGACCGACVSYEPSAVALLPVP